MTDIVPMYTRDQLAQAVIDLQRAVGYKEPVERAILNSGKFEPTQRDSTILTHRFLCKGNFGTEVADYRKAQAAKAVWDAWDPQI